MTSFAKSFFTGLYTKIFNTNNANIKINNFTVSIHDTYEFISFIDNWMINRNFKWNNDDWLRLISTINNGSYRFCGELVKIDEYYSKAALGNFLEARREKFKFNYQEDAENASRKIKNIFPSSYNMSLDKVVVSYTENANCIYVMPRYFDFYDSTTKHELNFFKKTYIETINKNKTEIYDLINRVCTIDMWP